MEDNDKVKSDLSAEVDRLRKQISEMRTESVKTTSSGMDAVLRAFQNPLIKYAFSNAQSPILFLKKDFTIFLTNENATEIFGFDKDELIGKKLKDIIHFEYVSRFFKDADNLSKKNHIETNYVFIKRNGSKFEAKVSFQRLKIEKKDIIAANIYSVDALSSILDKLKKENERYLDFEKACDAANFETDETMTFIFCSERIKRIIGYKPEEFEGLNFFEIFHLNENETVLGNIRDILKVRKSIDKEELTVQTAKGEKIIVVVNAVPFFSEQGTFKGYRGSFRDISHEFAIIREMKLLRKELELRVSERTAQLEKALEDLKYENEERKKAQSELIKVNKKIEDSRAEIVRESRKLLELNEKLAISEQNLKEANAAKDKFFSIIAHDLKNPLQSMILSSYLLVQNYKTLPDEKLEFQINTINNATNHLHNLLENLLQWSRSQTGRMEFSPEHINLIYLVKESAALLQPGADKKNMEIQTKVDDNTVVFVDSYMINTVLRNLISNAIKFNRQNGKIIIRSEERRDDVLVQVIDNGVGITPDVLQRLFRIDYHHTTRGTADEKGTGLGLILCKEFVEKNGGWIDVESSIGEGSDFKFTVPKGKNI